MSVVLQQGRIPSTQNAMPRLQPVTIGEGNSLVSRTALAVFFYGGVSKGDLSGRGGLDFVVGSVGDHMLAMISPFGHNGVDRL